jgi:hypothetical protein
MMNLSPTLTLLLITSKITFAQPINFKNFKQAGVLGDTVMQLSNNIMDVLQDSKNNYWFASWQDGLYKYDGKIILHFTTMHGLGSNRVEEIKEDKQGNIFINTSKGLYKYNGAIFTKLVANNSNENNWQLKPNGLWFKCLEQGNYVYRYNDDKLYKLKLPKIGLGENYIKNHPSYPNPYSIYSTYKDSKNNIWIGTASLGVCYYNGKKFKWITEPDVTELHNGPANGVRGITEDKNGAFWFNCNYTYFIKNKQNKNDTTTFYNRIKSIGSLDGKPDGVLDEYLSITKDKDTNLWIATYNAGVWKYDGKNLTK